MTKQELEVVLQNMTQQQAADHFGVHIATIKRNIKKHQIKYKKKSGGHILYRDNPLDPSLVLSELQKDVLTGSLLGDGFFMKYGSFRIKQCGDRREYIDYLHDVFLPFSTSIRTDWSRKPTRIDGKVSHDIRHWKGEYCEAASFTTRQHPVFDEWHKKWYPNGKKIVPEDIVLNKTVLVHWFCQDGCNNSKKNYIRLSTDGFHISEVERLVDKIASNIGLKCRVRKHGNNHVIYVFPSDNNSYHTFNDMMSKHVVWSCFKYKINSMLIST